MLGTDHCGHYVLTIPVLRVRGEVGDDKQSSNHGFGLQTNAKMSEYAFFFFFKQRNHWAGKPSKYQSLNKASLGKQCCDFCTETFEVNQFWLRI